MLYMFLNFFQAYITIMIINYYFVGINKGDIMKKKTKDMIEEFLIGLVVIIFLSGCMVMFAKQTDKKMSEMTIEKYDSLNPNNK